MTQRRLFIAFAAMLCIVTGLSLALRTQADDAPTADSPATNSPSANSPAARDTPTSNDSPTALKKTAPNKFPGRFPAPSLEGGTEWLNTAEEIDIRDLRGKVVLIDFWTYCCINCMHVLPDLKFLEQKYEKQLVVIGVHAYKFENEKEVANIRQAVLRYEIEHPVVNDSEKIIAGKYNMRSWPTLVIVDPEGQYVGYLTGEGNREVLDEIIGEMIAFHRAKGTLNEKPLRFDLERDRTKAGPLKFPGKILADEASNRLFIADSNHNRIVIATLDGKRLDVIGTGKIGSTDGGYHEAEFDHPQGMVLDGETLYIADTENHLLRTVDLSTKTVRTFAGTGEQARQRGPGGPLDSTPLNSPWALDIHDGTLFVAMAGPHQLFAHKLGSDTIELFAGNGREHIADGPRLAAELAQPSGLTHDGTHLYWVDSEGSAVRRMPFAGDNVVTTITGPHDIPGALFDFGDIDGPRDTARLQHPLGLVVHDGTLYVADTYNHKIKRIDPKTGESQTWLGTGESGAQLDPVQFSEPAGLSIAAGRLYIADTNNHRILTADLKTGEVAELPINELTPPTIAQ